MKIDYICPHADNFTITIAGVIDENDLKNTNNTKNFATMKSEVTEELSQTCGTVVYYPKHRGHAVKSVTVQIHFNTFIIEIESAWITAFPQICSSDLRYAIRETLKRMSEASKS